MVSPLRMAEWIRENLEETTWEVREKGGLEAAINQAKVLISSKGLHIFAPDSENPGQSRGCIIPVPAPKSFQSVRNLWEWVRIKILKKSPRVKNNEERMDDRLRETISEISKFATDQCCARYQRTSAEIHQNDREIREIIFSALTGGRES